jgi:DNA-binding GntR family transcriptional regulator
LDRKFHHSIIEIAQNKVALRLTETYHILGMVVQASRPHDVIREEHLRIVRAIEDRRAAKAEQAARQHVAGAREAIRKQIAEGEFHPKWVTGDSFST